MTEWHNDGKIWTQFIWWRKRNLSRDKYVNDVIPNKCRKWNSSYKLQSLTDTHTQTCVWEIKLPYAPCWINNYFSVLQINLSWRTIFRVWRFVCLKRKSIRNSSSWSMVARLRPWNFVYEYWVCQSNRCWSSYKITISLSCTRCLTNAMSDKRKAL